MAEFNRDDWLIKKEESRAQAYEMLEDGVKAYLKAEGGLLASLMEAVSALPDENDSDGAEDTDNDNSADDTESPVKQVIKYIKNAGKYTVKFINREMSKTVWVMLGAIGLLSINLGCCYGFYRRAKKRKIKKEEA